MEQVGGNRAGRHGTYGSLRLGPVTLMGKTECIDDSAARTANSSSPRSIEYWTGRA